MKRVLITGASGFLGRRLLPLLEQEELEIFAATTNPNKLQGSNKIHVVPFDLLSDQNRQARLREISPDIVLHLAWDQKKDTFRNDSTNLLWLAKSLLFFEEFCAGGGKRFVFAGTSSEYEAMNGRMQEARKAEQVSVYGECKRAFEATAFNYGKRTGVAVAVARYFTIYGEGDPHPFGAIPAAIRTLQEGKPFVCKAPNTIRDYIYVEDAARATKKLLTADFCGSINIASGLPHSMREVFQLIAAQMERESLLSFENERKPGNILVADTEKLKTQLVFTCETPFLEGMKKTIAWWEKQLGKEEKECSMI